ncbi:hypothetical protein LR48_Vigan11g098200 [Vigna angularis]|uniref:Uncharacterized protein n=1 Tax=Phaseolus angularis TaxID=3914 RepID=A0A0L9VT84_PHAAN|nr:hypothetical protein LR48_Vigan11g098200 [Vigna angularis]
MTEKEDQGESSLPIPNVAGKAPTLNYAAPTNKNTKARTKETVATPSKIIRTPSSEMIVIETAPLHEKGKVDCALRKGMSQKSARVLMNPPPPPFCPRSLPDGLWSSAFCLGDKIYFNMDDAERDKGTLKTKLQNAHAQLKESIIAHSQCEQKQKDFEELLAEARHIMENVQKSSTALKRKYDNLVVEMESLRKVNQEHKATIVSLKVDNNTLMKLKKNFGTTEREAKKEKNILRKKVREDKELMEEMGKAIVYEHNQGFEKALRQVP